MPLSSEKRLGRYILGTPLGISSLATMFEARGDQGERRVAIKVLSQYFGQDRGLVEECFAQARRVAALQHPHIVDLIEVGLEDTPWMASEYLAGGSLQERVGQPLPLDEVGSIVDQVASALDAAHAAGVIHGDLKPANVLSSESGIYKLGDFGMAGLAGGAHPLMRSSSSTPSPPYMPPEQALGMTVDKRSDVYSLGVLAYHLLTGTVPFPGTDPTTVWAKGLKGPPPDPSMLNPLIPPGVTRTLMTAMATNPLNRYPSAGAFADALRATLTEQPADAPTTQPEPPVPTAREEGPTPRARLTATWPRSGEEGPRRAPFLVRIGEGWRTILVVALAAVTGLLGGRVIDSVTAPPLPVSAISSAPGPGQWTMYQRDPSHSGFAAGPAPSFDGTIRWTFTMSEPLLASPAVDDDTVYLATGDRRIVAISAADGSVRWEHPVSGPVNGTPALAANLLYVGLRDGNVIALDRRTGRPAWSHDTGGAIVAPPLVSNGVLYIGNGNGRFEALDAVDGNPLWSFATKGWIAASSAITEDGTVVVASEDGNVYFLEPLTGKLRLTYRVALPIDSSPSTEGNVVFVGLGNGMVVGLDATRRQRPLDREIFRVKTQLFWWAMLERPPVQRGHLWIAYPGRDGASAVAVAGSVIVAGTRDGKVHGIEPGTGKQRWSFTTRTTSTLAPTAVGDTVYVSSTSGQVFALKAETGEAVWQWNAPPPLAPSTPPVVAGDTLYVGASSERPPVTLLLLGPNGAPLATGDNAATGSWYYRYGIWACSPVEGELVGPFPSESDASHAAAMDPPRCAVLYAIT